jgi:transcriptional regulator with XRE-family HTH domain
MEHDSESYVATRLADPEFAAAYEDAGALLQVLETLAVRRKGLDLSQREVARRMKTTQSAISDLESAQTDPRVSTLQRYARALDARLVLNLANPTGYSSGYIGPATVATYVGELTARFAWVTAGAELPQLSLGCPTLTGAFALQPRWTFDLGSLFSTHDAERGEQSHSEDDRPEPPELVLAA